jgi:hypothetical protein
MRMGAAEGTPRVRRRAARWERREMVEGCLQYEVGWWARGGAG